MSNADTRAAIAAALSTVTGITGYPKRPTTPAPGDGWPQWRGGEHAGGAAFEHTWAVLIMLPAGETSADDFADSHGEALVDALKLVMYVDRFDPATFKLSSNDAYALMITGRSE